jgi:beta-lactamase regulating signal transducer with metallopeptidase domain
MNGVALPTATDNGSLSVWLLGALVLLVVYFYRQLTARQIESEKRCRSENDTLRQEIQKMQDGIICESKVLAEQTTNALLRNADAYDRLMKYMEDTGRHRAIR